MATTPCEGIWNIAKPHSSAPTQSNKSDPTIRLWKFLHNHKGNLSRWGWFSFVTWDSLPIFDPGLHLEFILHDAIYMLWEARIVNRVQLRSCRIFAVLTKKHMTGSKVFWEEWWSICRDMLGRQLRGSFGSLLWMSPQGFAVSGSAKSRNGTYENCIVVYHFHAVSHMMASWSSNVHPPSRWSISCACNWSALSSSAPVVERFYYNKLNSRGSGWQTCLLEWLR